MTSERGVGQQVPFACFHCRKSYKRPAEQYSPRSGYEPPVTVCPECSQPLHFMGRYFKAPRQTDVKGWK